MNVLLINFYLISTTFVQDQEKTDGISSTGKPVVNATENHVWENVPNVVEWGRLYSYARYNSYFI